MRKQLGILGVLSTLALAGCTADVVDVVDEPVEEIDEALTEDFDSSSFVNPDDEDVIAGWCNFQNTWDANWASFESQVLTLVNQKRAAGATCGGVAKPPVAAVTLSSTLRCAARFHSKDMGTKNFFSHTGSNGSAFSQRIDNAGYVWTSAGENIAAGQTTPAAVVTSWMNSAGHCNNIMNGAFKHLGVGYYYASTATYKHYWTQDFGKP